MKKIPSFILILMFSFSCFAQEVITGTENEEGETILTEEGIDILNEELRKARKDVEDIQSDIDDINATWPLSRCRAYKSAAPQTLTPTTWALVVLDVESYDNLGEFTSNRFTATIAGYYLIRGNCYFSGLADGKHAATGIRVNGDVYVHNDSTQGAAGDTAFGVADILYLDVDDYVELWAYQADAVNRDIVEGNHRCFLAIHQLSN